MSNLPITIVSVLEVVLLLVPALVSVAFVTIAERKTMASMQRRLGPNSVGYLGLLQAFADATKLLLKEYVAPTQANITLFFLGPVITLIFGLLGYCALPWSVMLGIWRCRVKQPNSGEALKLILPSCSWKAISGWVNHSGTVTIYKTTERTMKGNRGSKSVICNNIAVKEQRVYGCLHIIFTLSLFKKFAFEAYRATFLVWTYVQRVGVPAGYRRQASVTRFIHKNFLKLEEGQRRLVYLRCTLRGFERNSNIKTLSKQFNIKNSSGLLVNLLIDRKAQIIHPNFNKKRTYSSTVLQDKPFNRSNSIHPWFITGFTDAEGCFTVSIVKQSTTFRTGWEVRLNFQIKLHKRDLALLENIQASLGGIGFINLGKDCVFRVRKFNQVLSVIDFFDQYPLITQKKADYILFKQVALIMKQKQHLTQEGLLNIVKLRASLNLGLTDVLKSAFPDICATTRPQVTDQKIPHSQWVAGFTSGEGHFQVAFAKNRYSHLTFKINQHDRDEHLMKSLIEYWGCGNYYPSEKSPAQRSVLGCLWAGGLYSF